MGSFDAIPSIDHTNGIAFISFSIRVTVVVNAITLKYLTFPMLADLFGDQHVILELLTIKYQ